MTTTKTWDNLNRLTSISSQPSASYTLPISFNYAYNSADQRIQNTLNDGSYWQYGYDPLGQVTNGCKYFSNGTNVAGQQFDYAFDTVGNRTQTKAGGDYTGANLRVANYTNNTLNQIIGRDVSSNADIMGASILTNIVTVAGQTAYRKQEYFRQQVSVNNSTSSVWTNIVVSGGQSVTGHVYVAKAPEAFSYDADGNLTNDGRFAYSWDAENRLIGMTVNTTNGPQYQLSFAYDYKGRRIQKLVATNSVSYATNTFLYDGWNLAATLNPQLSPINSFLWGSDLSGTIQGAGGVGGLLEVSYYGSQTTNCFVAYDGNGNVASLINAANGAAVATYEYGPFGEVIRATGLMAKANPLRFSSKYQDDETDLQNYGRRFYSASPGRWLSCDPVDEPGFALLLGRQGGRSSDSANRTNPYRFVRNVPVSRHDFLGLTDNCDPLGLGPAPRPEEACCNGQKIADGLKVLTKRWLDAVQYLNDHNVQIDNDDVNGVSCVESANHILAFMAPVPRCWRCYIQRRSWKAGILNDENSILCEAAFLQGRDWTGVMAYDWFYEKHENYSNYTPIPQWKYEWIFFWDLNPTIYGWWTKNDPAPHDDCVSKSPIRPERYEFLESLLPPYGGQRN